MVRIYETHSTPIENTDLKKKNKKKHRSRALEKEDRAEDWGAIHI